MSGALRQFSARKPADGGVILYDSGTQVVPWTAVVPMIPAAYVAGNWAATAEAAHLEANQNAWASASNTSGGLRTAGLVDLSGVNTVRFSLDLTTSGSAKRAHCAVGPNADGSGATVQGLMVGGGGAVTVDLDVAAVTTSLYVLFYGSSLRSGSGGSSGDNIVRASKVELL